MAVDDGTYEEYIALVEKAHGVRLTPAQIDKLNARLDNEEEFLVPMTFAEALGVIESGATGYGTNHVSIREHVLAVAAELEE